MSVRYRIKPTPKQLKQMKACWLKLQSIEESYYGAKGRLEDEMELLTGIEGIEFFSCDGAVVGIGNGARTMKLIQREKLE